jgi:hypothetical protein
MERALGVNERNDMHRDPVSQPWNGAWKMRELMDVFGSTVGMRPMQFHAGKPNGYPEQINRCCSEIATEVCLVPKGELI